MGGGAANIRLHVGFGDFGGVGGLGRGKVRGRTGGQEASPCLPLGVGAGGWGLAKEGLFLKFLFFFFKYPDYISSMCFLTSFGGRPGEPWFSSRPPGGVLNREGAGGPLSVAPSPLGRMEGFLWPGGGWSGGRRGPCLCTWAGGVCCVPSLGVGDPGLQPLQAPPPPRGGSPGWQGGVAGVGGRRPGPVEAGRARGRGWGGGRGLRPWRRWRRRRRRGPRGLPRAPRPSGSCSGAARS